LYHIRSITQDLLWIGASDRRLARFENLYPIPRGVSYNSYLLLDDKTVLLDTADVSVSERFFENLTAGLAGRELDYVIVHHVEPDHCAALEELLRRYPQVRIVGNAKTQTMLGQFFCCQLADRFVTVKEGETLSTGRHTLQFVMAPMVHWPEVMLTYDTLDGTLFSADAFGTFGAFSGHIFADEVDFPGQWLADARRYYANIVGKYGTQVQAVLKKAAGLDIRQICPLHGPIWRENIPWLLDKYQHWSSWTPEEKAVMIVYGSVYGHTENAAELLAGMLAERGVKRIALYDASVTHVSELVGEAFRCSHLVFAASTYNGGIFTPVETLLQDLKAHALQNRTAALIENGSWAAQSGKQMREMLESMKNIRVLDQTVSLKSSLKEESRQALEQLADTLAAELKEG
jgi:flavorubredoxin